MLTSIDNLALEFASDLSQALSVSDLEGLRIKYLGKKSPLQALMKGLKDVSPEERPQAGKLINDFRDKIESELREHLVSFENAAQKSQLESEKIDVTLPGRRRHPGRKHIINQTLDQIIDILVGMGFSVQYGPDIDNEFYNFEALNFAADHPARDMQDTFYISDDMLLRTHTSNVQVRVMESHAPPLRFIVPGRVYRNETITARSHVFFHQVEGLYIDKNVTFADLLATMKEFLTKLFQTHVEVRFRPSYFPFVEPGMEIDIGCLACEGKGCSLCKFTGWLEVAGAGMVHPEVLKNGGIDPEEFSGYAWGMGVERLALLRYGIPDIRFLAENDLRMLAQFPAI